MKSWFLIRGENHREKTSRSHNNQQTQSTYIPGIQEGAHWWKASAITTTPTLLPVMYCINSLFVIPWGEMKEWEVLVKVSLASNFRFRNTTLWFKWSVPRSFDSSLGGAVCNAIGSIPVQARSLFVVVVVVLVKASFQLQLLRKLRWPFQLQGRVYNILN